MRFSDIVGQERIIEKWKNAYYKNRLHPVMLLQGHEGAGALPLALAFGQFLLCEKHAGETSAPSLFLTAPASEEKPLRLEDSCGECGSCKRIQAFTHPDLHFFFPIVVPSKADDKEKKFAQDYITEWKTFIENEPYGNLFDWLSIANGDLKKQANISAKECANFIEIVHKKAYEGRRKIIIFWMPELLEKEANRLLKSLEELPDDTYLFFVSADSALLLPTFLSRCLLVHIAQPSNEDIKRYLLARTPSMKEEDIDFTLSMADGNMRLVYKRLLITSDKRRSIDEGIADMLYAIAEGGPRCQVEWINALGGQGREYVKQFLQTLEFYLQSYWSGYARAKDGHAGAPLSASKEQARIFDTLRQIGMENYAEECFYLINQTYAAIEQNSSIKIELHAFIIQWHTLLKKGRLFYS